MIFDRKNTDPLFDMLERCRGVPQDDGHHPEGDVLNHSLQVLRWALRESDGDVDLVLAAMLHDVGKAEESHGHEKIAVKWLADLVSPKTLWLIENHMRVWYYIKGEMHGLKKCMELAGHPWFAELVQLARWDRMGRVPDRRMEYDREEIVEDLNGVVYRHFGRAPDGHNVNEIFVLELNK